MGILALLWGLGLLAYFAYTNERQRENVLLIMWGLMLLPTAYYGVKLLFGL